MNQLIFRYEADPQDDVGRLWLHLQAARFSGSGFFWSYRDGLSEFAKGLQDYPICKPLVWSTGYDSGEGDDAVLGVEIHPAGTLGHLVAVIRVADLDDPAVRLRAKLATSYAALDELREQLVALGKGHSDEAILRGE